jgi:ATP-dependent DNA helicase RecQ
MASSNTPEEILKTTFGYGQFKPLQREVIENVLHKRDTLAVMPTGGGKSLCYQIPSLIFKGLTVVVSPLIALMKDQVEQLHALGIPALFLNSSLSQEEYQANMIAVLKGQVKLLYVAPETLLTPRLFDLLSVVQLDCLTIDEAHCISEWGHDFRPEYRRLVEARARFPQAVCLALTATATGRVRSDIMQTLHFEASNEFIASFNRPNLLIEVRPKRDPAGLTLEFLQGFKDKAGIIYCFSRRQVDELAAFLALKGYSAQPYHAGLEDSDRKRNQEAFIRDDCQIIVATIAFGMGINKPNVRFVVHYDLPKSIEGYYQEIGRAGRDGLPAHCLLLYSAGDVIKLRHFINQKEVPERQTAYDHLKALTRFVESDACRRIALLAYFGERYSEDNCGMCDHCLSARPIETDITLHAQKFLSCVKRTGEMFGARYVAEVLLGEETTKVHKFNHQTLTTFVIGKDLTRPQWEHIAHQLVQKGLVRQDDQYGSLKLTPQAYLALKTKEKIMGVLQPAERRMHTARKMGELDYDTDLYDLLRVKRKALAEEESVAPYVVFSDRTLVEMAAYYPQRPESLREIYGVGNVKAERYGPTFLEVICAYCSKRQLPEKGKTPVAEEERLGRSLVVSEAYNSGQSIPELMARYQVTRGTILEHLLRFAQAGYKLRRSDEILESSALSPSMQAEVLGVFAELGIARLAPVFERLKGAVTYDELKLLRVYFVSTKR